MTATICLFASEIITTNDPDQLQLVTLTLLSPPKLVSPPPPPRDKTSFQQLRTYVLVFVYLVYVRVAQLIHDIFFTTFFIFREQHFPRWWNFAYFANSYTSIFPYSSHFNSGDRRKPTARIHQKPATSMQWTSSGIFDNHDSSTAEADSFFSSYRRSSVPPSLNSALYSVRYFGPENCLGISRYMKNKVAHLAPFLFLSSWWSTRDHIGRSIGISNPAWHLPQVVPRVDQTTGSVHPQPTLPNC